MSPRRYHVDGESTPPEIVAVGPMSPRFRYAHTTLRDAKAELVDVVRMRIGELREAVRQARALRVRDFTPNGATETPQTPGATCAGDSTNRKAPPCSTPAP